MTMAWKSHNYTIKMRWLRHTCSINMTRTWQHICNHAYRMTMTWSCQEYEVNMTHMIWHQHDNDITNEWPWDDHDTMVMSFLCHGHRMVIVWSCHSQFLVMPGLCHYHDMAMHWTVVITWSQKVIRDHLEDFFAMSLLSKGCVAVTF